MSSAAVDFADNMSYAILNNDDLATVEAGGPAYLLMVDGLLHSDPDNESMLRAASNLYAAYAGIYVKDPIRAQKLTDKALGYASRAICIHDAHLCSLRTRAFQRYASLVADTDITDVDVLYALGAAWSAWIQAHREDWSAIAEISRVEAIMQRVVELDEFHADGRAHLYLGVLATLLPAALGGKPDIGRQHFERAIEISNGKNLMAKVMYARRYARLVFDRKLHDRLLEDVLRADPNVPGYALVNTLAQKQAQELLESAEDYF